MSRKYTGTHAVKKKKKKMTETNIYCKQLPVEQQWYAEEKQKWNLVGKMVTDLKFVTRSEKELGGITFLSYWKKKKM